MTQKQFVFHLELAIIYNFYHDFYYLMRFERTTCLFNVFLNTLYKRRVIRFLVWIASYAIKLSLC